MSALDEAERFLQAVLADGSRPAQEVAALSAAQGIRSATLRRAAKAIRVQKTKEGQPRAEGRWVWALPEDAHTHVSAFEGDSHLRAGEILAGLVLENGRTWGECAAPVQIADAEAVLAPSPGARRFWIGRGRGFSKTSDAGALTIAAVLGGVIAPGERGYFAASDKDQARLAADAIGGWARRSDLGGLVVVESGRVRFPHHDVEIEIMSSDAPSAWGRRGVWWVVDELPSWADTPNSRAFYEAISTSWPKVPTVRVLIIGTASSPAHFSHAVYNAAVADPAWRVSDCHEVAPWLNPADIEGERRRLSAASFSRLWRNEWVEAEDHLVTSENLARCVTLSSSWPLKPVRGKRYVIGVDIGVKKDATAIAVGHAQTVDGERHVVLDAMEVFRPQRGAQVPLAAVEQRIETLEKRYHRADVLFDPNQALSMLQSLRRRGVKVQEHTFSARSNDKMTTLLHTMLRDGQIDLPDDPELIDELLHVRIVETSAGLVSVDTVPGRHDDQVDALGIAAVRLIEQPTPRPGYAVSAADHTLEYWWESGPSYR